MTTLDRLNDLLEQFTPDQDVKIGKWFGKPCLKAENKVFVVMWGASLAFKLSGEAHCNALKIEGGRLFDPRGKGHPMKEWVIIPGSQSRHWSKCAGLAYEYVIEAQ